MKAGNHQSQKVLQALHYLAMHPLYKVLAKLNQEVSRKKECSNTSFLGLAF
jgi:hypothetical protein